MSNKVNNAVVFNMGSMSIDHVFSVKSIVKPGETISSSRVEQFPGGKGLNQSVALGRAGVRTCHIGHVGKDGNFLISELEKASVDATDVVIEDNGIRLNLEKASVDATDVVRQETRTGQTFIQVSESGENSIVLDGGANLQFTSEDADKLKKRAITEDVLLLQNEINMLETFVEVGYNAGMRIALNPAPMGEAILKLPLEKITWLIVNEMEAAQLIRGIRKDLSSTKEGRIKMQHLKIKSADNWSNSSVKDALITLNKLYPKLIIALTQGAQGAIRMDDENGPLRCHFPAPGKVIDTTAAGDTFTGYFLAGEIAHMPPELSLQRACAAAAVSVTRKGAASSIPTMAELDEVLSAHRSDGEDA